MIERSSIVHNHQEQEYIMKVLELKLKHVNKYGGASYKAVADRRAGTVYFSPSMFTEAPPEVIEVSSDALADPPTERAAKSAEAKAAREAERAEKKAAKEAERAEKKAAREAERAEKQRQREELKAEREAKRAASVASVASPSPTPVESPTLDGIE